MVLAVRDDPSDVAMTELGALYGTPVHTEAVTATEFEQLVERIATESDRLVSLDRITDEIEDERTADVRDLANQPPVIRYVNLLLREASDAAASDIHLEATRNGLVARFRLDGMLAPAPEPPRELHHAVVSRIKTIAELDIAERRRPQDGRIRVRLAERELDLRVSTVPTVHGESVVLRLLDRGGSPVELDALGMPEPMLDRLLRLVRRPHGLLLVTGPTGSGKTTTLYGALRRRDARREKIITVEDPVEYELDAVTQVPVHRQAGVTFASALRAILRQDPDVVMIGEMRDRETAEIAVQAAMTGHLVLSTLHTNDAIGAIPRLLDLGVADYLVASTVDAVLAQRLLRVNCRQCAQPTAIDASVAAGLAGRPVERATGWVGAGCDACRGTGFRGRTGLFELVEMTDELRAAIARGATRAELADAVERQGAHTLREHGWQLVSNGTTTVEEVLRVVQS